MYNPKLGELSEAQRVLLVTSSLCADCGFSHLLENTAFTKPVNVLQQTVGDGLLGNMFRKHTKSQLHQS